MTNDNQSGSTNLEDDYFRKQDQELIEKMRKVATEEEARRALGAESGVQDRRCCARLQSSGSRPTR